MNIQPAYNKKNIPIVFSSDRNYFPYFLVALESIIQNGHVENNYDILLLNSDLSDEHKQIDGQERI